MTTHSPREMVAFTRLEGLSFDGGAWRAAASSVDGMLGVRSATFSMSTPRRSTHMTHAAAIIAAGLAGVKRPAAET